MKKQLFLLTALFMGITMLGTAQSAIVPVGGDAQSSAGSVSYTVGQIAVQTVANSNGIYVAEGVQQPYEIQAVGVDNYPQIVLDAVVYPNPTENIAQLKLNGFELPADGLRATIFDGNGKMLQSFSVTGDLTSFQIGQYATGTYYLEVKDGKRVLKTFKIVRK
ncbi:MAG: T9SS type A sorting domain-containing protein [Bacteroidales bacterium]|nr:T9SS type A sorting domain-containing protein [Bacteroidales bacterium]